MLSLKAVVAGSHFTLFCFCDLDLDPTTFMYELDHISRRRTCRPKFKAVESCSITNMQTHRKIQVTKNIITPLHGR